jgi:shikimate kinase
MKTSAKTLVLLIGPKGSGKTHIGCLVERELGIPFLRVEPIWLALKSGEDGWKKVEQEIAKRFETTDVLIIESLGAGDGFRGMKQSLESRYTLKFVKVKTNLDECLRRVQTRSKEQHIAVSDEKVVEYNQIAARVELPWSAVIENDGPAAVDEVLRTVRRLIG